MTSTLVSYVYKHIYEVTLLLSTIKNLENLHHRKEMEKYLMLAETDTKVIAHIRKIICSLSTRRAILTKQTSCVCQSFVTHVLKTDVNRTIFSLFGKPAKIEGIMVHPGALHKHISLIHHYL